MRSELFIDGGCRPTNPGPSGFAAVLRLPDGSERLVSRYIGWSTNNVAEYHGLVVGIKLAIAHIEFARGLDIYTDSKLLVGHLAQGWRVKSMRLKVLQREAIDLLTNHYSDSETGEWRWSINWIPRNQNSQADQLCTAAILQHRQQHPNPFSIKAGI